MFIHQPRYSQRNKGTWWSQLGFKIQTEYVFLHLLTFTPSLSVGHWVWAIQYPGELVQDLSDEKRNIWWILLPSLRLWYVCVVKYLTGVAVQPWCNFLPSNYSVKDGFISSQFHTCLEMVAGKSCGCQDANRGIEDLQIRLGISAQALGDGEAGKRKGCRLQGGFSGRGNTIAGLKPILGAPKKNYEILMSSKSIPAPKKISKPVSHRIWEKLLEKPRAEYRQVNQFSVVSHHFHDSNDRIFAKILLKATTKNWFGISWNFQSCKGLNFRFPTSMERRIVVPIIFIYVLETFGKRTIIPIIFTYFQSVSIMFQWFSPV